MNKGILDAQVAAVRGFNRFYTQKIGVLGEALMQSPYSLTQGRVLYELFSRERCTASELAQDLGLDAGYLSRILAGFHKQKLLEKTPSLADGRQTILSLSPEGRSTGAGLDAASRGEVGALLSGLEASQRAELVQALGTVQRLLGGRMATTPAGAQAGVRLRPHGIGDLGWLVQRHGELYAQEYGWGIGFEAMVAGITGELQRNFNPETDGSWVAEQNGQRLGCVFLVRQSDQVAKLRLLLLEPAARGQGLGRRLVEESLHFARETGYAKVTLWTNSVLSAARHIYECCGFVKVAEEAGESFGQQMVFETWELDL